MFKVKLEKIEDKKEQNMTFSVLEAIRGHERSQIPLIKFTMILYMKWEA